MRLSLCCYTQTGWTYKHNGQSMTTAQINPSKQRQRERSEQAQALQPHTLRHHQYDKKRANYDKPNSIGYTQNIKGSRGEREDKGFPQVAQRFVNDLSHTRHNSSTMVSSRTCVSIVTKPKPYYHAFKFLLSWSQNSIIMKSKICYHGRKFLLSWNSKSVITRSIFYYHGLPFCLCPALQLPPL